MKSSSRPNFDEITLWLGATRYYVGRRTYAVVHFCDMLIKNWPKLHQATKDLIQRELEIEFGRDDDARMNGDKYKPLGDDSDREDWEKVRSLWINK